MSYTILERGTDAEWMEQRREHITATDMARLSCGGPAAWASVKAEKQGFGNGFAGNRWTEWGKEREPVIAEFVAFGFDVAPNAAVCVSDENPRWAATPDGLGRGRIGEYKTTIHDWSASVDAIPKQYLAQVDWAQLVTGAQETVFAWEPHENFVPGEIRTLIIPRDESRISALIEVSERFEEYLGETDAHGEFDDLIAAYAEADAAVSEATARLDAVKEQIRERAGDRDVSAKSPFGSLSYSWPKPRETFDATAFKKAHPDMVGEFMKLTPPKQQTLRVSIKHD